MNKGDDILDFSEFNEDCYAECEEHFVIIRRGLLALEQMVGTNQFDPKIIQELFRSYHTLKGLTGMIGQVEAEKLAHYQENYLKLLDKGSGNLLEKDIDVMFEGVKALEDIITALRNNQNLPDMTDLIEELSHLGNEVQTQSEESNDSDSSATLASQTNADDDKMEGSYLLSFIPDKKLFAKGINVNKIKSDIEKVGQLIKTEPIVQDGGQVNFNFTVKSNLMLSEIEKIMEGNVKVEKLQKKQPSQSVPINKNSQKEKEVTITPLSTSSKSNLIRIDLQRLDDIMKMVGDLVVSRSRMEESLKSMEGKIAVKEHRVLQENFQQIERQLRSLREGVMRIRLVPIADVFERMQFVVRDLMKENQKKIHLELKGKETEIDKAVVEKMLDPLLHLVRNSVSHGLETPEERKAAGKPEVGNISLRAFTSGDSVIVEIEDDGKGLDKAKVIETAINKGLIEPKDDFTDNELLDIICSQGFSTCDEVDRISGRGVGMAVVKKNIQDLGGILRLSTRMGIGTKFTIQLPITLAIIDALIVEVNQQKFAMPQPLIEELLKLESDQLMQLENNEMMQYRHGVIPVIRLSDFFHLNCKAERKDGYVIIVGKEEQAVGLMVDKILRFKEIMVQPLAKLLSHLEGISGTSELGDNKVLLILDAMQIIKADLNRKRKQKA